MKTYKHPFTLQIFSDEVWAKMHPEKVIHLKELNDGSFGVPEPHTDIRHPDYFEAKADHDQWAHKVTLKF